MDCDLSEVSRGHVPAHYSCHHPPTGHACHCCQEYRPYSHDLYNPRSVKAAVLAGPNYLNPIEYWYLRTFCECKIANQLLSISPSTAKHKTLIDGQGKREADRKHHRTQAVISNMTIKIVLMTLKAIHSNQKQETMQSKKKSRRKIKMTKRIKKGMN